jgi:GNAT superfamily N-acetyltransferase
MWSSASQKAPRAVQVELRELRPSDRSALERAIRGTEAFNEEEVAVALELIDSGLEGARPDPYLFTVAADERGEALGYACYGRTALTDGVYDLYWIVVAASAQRFGVGRKLLDAAAKHMRSLGGRMIIIETAGKPEYEKQRAFYERVGCKLLARYPDFYRVGDDKLVYVLNL